MDDPLCQDCGKQINRRMKANVWQEETVLCTPCFHAREAAVLRAKTIAKIIGIADSPWLIHDGRRQSGPFTTREVIEHLRDGRFKWDWKSWRQGLETWKPLYSFFTDASLHDGRLELRDLGQGECGRKKLDQRDSRTKGKAS